MKTKSRAVLLVVAVLAFAVLALAQQRDWSKVEIKVIHVAKNIYMLQGEGGNIGVSVGTDGLLIVDDQFAPLAPKIEAALKQLNPGKLKFLLNTHHHGDHTGGNAHFGREAHIIAHENVRKRLTGSPKEALPVITFDESLHVHFNGEEIRLAHLPHGHTDGDAMIHFTGANVIHMGDQFFSGRFPNIDLSGGGDVRGFIRNIEHVMANLPPDVKLIPGHGPLSTVKELKESHEMLVETTRIVEKQIAAGKSLAEIKAAGLPEKWKSWAVPTMTTERWIEIIYRSLSRVK
jgi:glyoxylase-like metal-dependent hydrolase (beta-lactamase superfamily II)